MVILILISNISVKFIPDDNYFNEFLKILIRIYLNTYRLPKFKNKKESKMAALF